MTIRPAQPGEEARIASICLLTGAAGTDATGMFSNDTALADVYATPYLYGPSGFALVWDVGGEARGYVVGASDTSQFQTWFTDTWWPQRAPLHPQRTEDDACLLPSAAEPDRMFTPALDAYPAHLHIDLLPDQQGQGAGRQLIEAACNLLADRGVPGVHLVAQRANAGAQAFYPKVGFTAIDESETAVTFARRLAG